MADNTTTILTGGVSTTVQQDYSVTDLAPNNYLTIIWKNSAGEQFDNLDINETEANQFTNDLNNAIEQGISNGKVSYAGSKKYVNVESVAKYLAQNVIKTSSKRTVVNALIGLASGDRKNLTNSVKSLCVNVFGNIADKVAKNFGFSDPFEVFSSFAGENTIEFFSELGNKAKDYIDEATSKFKKKKQEETQTQSVTTSTTEETAVKTTKKYIGFVFGLTTSDTESYEIIIPRKKVEDGSDYTTHLLPQRFKKDFSVILTNKVITSNYDKEIEIDNIESVKNKLIEIANSRILFDIYIRLSSGKCYKRSNVYFSSISFTKDENSGNNYTCSFTVEPIESFKSKVYVSNRKYFPTASKSSGTGTGGKKGGSGGTGSNTGGTKYSNNKAIKVGYYNKTSDERTCESYSEALRVAHSRIPKEYVVRELQGTSICYYFIKESDTTIFQGIRVRRADLITSLEAYTGKVKTQFKNIWKKGGIGVTNKSGNVTYNIN